MLASAVDVLDAPFDALKGRFGGAGTRVPSPTAVGGLQAWYDTSDLSSLVYDGSNRVSLVADKSGNSAVNCLALDGSSSNAATTPSAAPIKITGDIDLRVQVAMADWTPSATSVLLAKDDTAVQRSYTLFISTDGKLNLLVFKGAGGNFTETSASAVPFADMAKGWVRATLDVDNGASQYAVAFYWSNDGATWTQIGSTTVGAGPVTILDSTAQLTIGANGTTTFSNRSNCRVYRAQIYNGIAGTLAFDFNPALSAKLATTATDQSANAATITINTSGATGARICGERDLYQGTVASQPVYLRWLGENYGYLNGISGNSFSTPDSSAVSVTGDIDLRAKVALTDWTPSASQVFLAKDATGANRSYVFYCNTSGTLGLNVFTDGSTLKTATSSTSTGFTDGTVHWVRVTRASASGSVIFYTSEDGSSWSPLGTTQSTTAGGVFDSTATLEVGSFSAAPLYTAGTIYRAQVYNGIGGTLAFDFNPAAYTSGSTFLDQSANGATITLNGGATICTRDCLYADGSNDYLKAAPFSLSQPETVHFVGQQVSWTAGDTLYDGNLTDTGHLQQDTATPRLRAYAGASLADIRPPLQTAFLASVGFNGVNGFLRLNNNTATTGNTGSSAMNGFTLMLGGTGSGSTYANATASEIAIYSTAQDTATQDRLANYFSRKWSLGF